MTSQKPLRSPRESKRSSVLVDDPKSIDAQIPETLSALARLLARHSVLEASYAGDSTEAQKLATLGHSFSGGGQRSPGS